MDLRLYFGKWGCFKSDHMFVERIQPPFFFFAITTTTQDYLKSTICLQREKIGRTG